MGLSGLPWGGTLGRLIDAPEEQGIERANSAALLGELQGVIAGGLAGHLAKHGLTVVDGIDD